MEYPNPQPGAAPVPGRPQPPSQAADAPSFPKPPSRRSRGSPPFVPGVYSLGRGRPARWVPSVTRWQYRPRRRCPRRGRRNPSRRGHRPCGAVRHTPARPGRPGPRRRLRGSRGTRGAPGDRSQHRDQRCLRARPGKARNPGRDPARERGNPVSLTVVGIAAGAFVAFMSFQFGVWAVPGRPAVHGDRSPAGPRRGRKTGPAQRA